MNRPFTLLTEIGRPRVTVVQKTKEVFLSTTAGPYKKKADQFDLQIVEWLSQG